MPDHKTNQTDNLTSTTTTNNSNKKKSGTTKKKNTGNAPKAFVSLAASQVGNGPSKYQKFFGLTADWCAMFVWWVACNTFGNKPPCTKSGMAHDIQESFVKKGGSWVCYQGKWLSEPKSGDIITFDYDHNNFANHVGIIKSVEGSTLHTIEGNYSNKVSAVTRSRSEVYRVARPKWPDGSFAISTNVDLVDDIDSADSYGATVSMANRIAMLISSENYTYLVDSKKKSEETAYLNFSNLLTNYNLHVEESNNALLDAIQKVVADLNRVVANQVVKDSKSTYKTVKGKLNSYTNVVEAPYVELDLAGIKIGTFTRSGNKYKFPNFINSLNIVKINGGLNQYKIGLTYQIEAFDDPNFIDNLLSKVRYDAFNIRYGDSNGSGYVFKEEEIIISDVKSNRDYTSSRINYTITAISSAGKLISSSNTYPSKVDKPSNAIIDLLYNSGEQSKQLMQYFPGMRDKNLVLSKGLIPVDDININLAPCRDVDIITYLNYLVSVMSSNTSNGSTMRDSVYYLTFHEDYLNEFGGPYFKITKVNTSESLNTNTGANTFDLDIGFPGNNFVMDFNINTDTAWSILYDNASNADAGDSIVYGASAATRLCLTEQDKNWWTQVTKFPITATVTLKGLTVPVMLMSYINLNVVFYGQKHLASGLYVVTKQEDRLTAAGYRTILSLTRVSE